MFPGVPLGGGILFAYRGQSKQLEEAKDLVDVLSSRKLLLARLTE
jgi:hypothetical protein